ncbi:Imm52 family immunity protein [Pectobacterium brasiliense]|uniref:Imm52 family immunity protein n=1 Tax=Pectobacterium brasiliense TaxID=180957 RepID=UPI00227B36AB|nr:Imm52 family immunity protein [Pectobacterium brasiliense]WGL28669.1 Imm52 family immunity protein [Pectobacterium brasiliense]WJM81142.1 Imm52 family immunity protein [Pectobacterium brasiliense]
MEIKFHIYLKIVDADIDTLLELFLKFSELDSIYHNSLSDWFLTDKSKKQAEKQCIIRQGELTDESSYLLGKALNNLPCVAKGMWSETGTRIDVRNYVCSDLDNYWLRFTLPKGNEADIKKVMMILSEMINHLEPHIITLETNEYSINKSQVFPDRIPVGWIIYIDHVYGESDFDLGERAINVKKTDKSIGTLFVSKKGFFDGGNEQDIKAANDLEILLAAHSVLPLYKDIF